MTYSMRMLPTAVKIHYSQISGLITVHRYQSHSIVDFSMPVKSLHNHKCMCLYGRTQACTLIASQVRYSLTRFPAAHQKVWQMIK